MNQKLYYKAYKFLKFRATEGKNPMQVLDALKYKDSEAVEKFLRINHQVKFI